MNVIYNIAKKTCISGNLKVFKLNQQHFAKPL